MALISNKAKILLRLFLPQRKTPNPKHVIPEADKNLTGKTILFTGGTDGIGLVATQLLYNMGANIVLLGRSRRKGETVIHELTSSEQPGHIRFQLCDLSLMSDVKAAANQILHEHETIDFLINCAGINAVTSPITKEGFETNWAVNYLAPYLLSQLLLKRLRLSARSRIINLTTNTDFIEHLDLTNLQEQPDFNTPNPYIESKLALSMFTYDLAKKLTGSNITVNCLNPGFIKSNLLRDLGSNNLLHLLMRVMASPAEVGADRIVRLAVSSKFQDTTGIFMSEDHIKPAHPDAQNAQKRALLAQISQNALKQWL